ncbi:hypothetical protein Pmani_008493 [Petrolisthes manimaculis]|uniref:Uncharacterized protein n=1 Tax=Petrolisthes manimaculis TaxID=1843537 RepID=A0AAE1UIW5_9EUCA|nr:hypothetical protein Pmani_008493 [Petrolisthes manimaculis]
MKRYFERINWTNLLDQKPLEEMWNDFLAKYNDALTKFVPKQPTQTHNNHKPKWMTSSVQRKIDAKEAAWERYRRRRSRYRYLIYCNKRNISTDAVRAAKHRFELNLTREVRTNPRPFYAYCRSNTTIKEEVTQMKRRDGSLTKTNLEASKLLNEEFQKVFQREDNEVPRAPNVFEGKGLTTCTFTIAEIF